jgi:hypothetical protein
MGIEPKELAEVIGLIGPGVVAALLLGGLLVKICIGLFGHKHI